MDPDISLVAARGGAIVVDAAMSNLQNESVVDTLVQFLVL